MNVIETSIFELGRLKQKTLEVSTDKEIKDLLKSINESLEGRIYPRYDRAICRHKKKHLLFKINETGSGIDEMIQRAKTSMTNYRAEDAKQNGKDDYIREKIKIGKYHEIPRLEEELEELFGLAKKITGFEPYLSGLTHQYSHSHLEDRMQLFTPFKFGLKLPGTCYGL